MPQNDFPFEMPFDLGDETPVEIVDDTPIEITDEETVDTSANTVEEVSQETTEVVDNATKPQTSDDNKKNDKADKNNALIDKEIGVDYSYILNRSLETVVVSDEEIAEEDTELLRAFLSSNADIKNYIDKSYFDAQGKVATHIINLIKDKNYKVTVGKNEYRLGEAILLKAMGECYTYVQGIAKALAQKTSNKNCIQLSDEDVYTMAENFFKHTSNKITISDGTSSSKSSARTSKKDDKSKTKKNDVANKKPVAEEVKPSSEQISFFDL